MSCRLQDRANKMKMAAAYCPIENTDWVVILIATGEADLTKRLPASSRDEIGDVVNGFNSFSEKLQTIIGDVKHSKEDLVVAGSDMSSASENTTNAISQIIENIGSIKNQIENQGQSVNQAAGAVNEITGNIESLERMIVSQGKIVTEASSAVNMSMDKMSGSFETLRVNSQDGFNKQQSVNDKVKEIETQSQMLQEANASLHKYSLKPLIRLRIQKL